MEFIKKHWVGLMVGFLLTIMFALMFFSNKGDSLIIDEIAHIPAGYSYITTGDYRLNPEHPPLIKDLAAIPLYLTGMKFPYEYWKANNPVVNNQWEDGWRFVYRMGNDPELMKVYSHIPVMLLSLLFGFFVFKWAKELYGEKAGILALVLFVFNTNIIAHSRFVTTDMGISFAFFVAMYALYHYLKKPSLKSLFWATFSFAVVLVTKFSAAVMVPTYGIVFLMLLIRKSSEKPETYLQKINDPVWWKRIIPGILSFAFIGFVGLLFMWLFYLPHTINMPAQVQKDLIVESLPNAGILTDTLVKMSDNQVTKPIGQYFLGFAMVASHVEGGHDAFLLGQVSNKGWWYYYPVTIAIKTQIALFALLLMAAIFWRKIEKKDWFTEVFFFTLPAVLLFMGMTGSINLGIRYMLPIYAFLFVFVSKLATKFDWNQIRNIWNKGLKIKKDSWARANTILVTIFVSWYVLAAIFIYPFYLAYFNEFVGGYKNGYKYLTDSNVDWGQDVKRLANYVDDKGIERIYVDVFPGSMPASYFLGNKMIEWHVQNGQPKGWFAVSATFYQNSKLKKGANGGMDYAWLDSKKPVEVLGGSILIYDLR
jgi:4-amino-4-deoxy-L-arabinose transferase-like glycosyltransferase